MRLVPGEQVLYSGHTKVEASHTERLALMLGFGGSASAHWRRSLLTPASFLPSSSPTKRTLML